jgi:hypothetical protein
LLVQRRVEIDSRYRNRRTFCSEKQIEYRVISDIEGARRSNFSPAMIAAIEVAYELPPGTIREALHTPDLQALPRGRTHVGPVHAGAAFTSRVDIPPEVHLEDLREWEQHIWLTPDLTVHERALLIHLMRICRGQYAGDDVDELVGFLGAVIKKSRAFGDLAQPVR